MAAGALALIVAVAAAGADVPVQQIERQVFERVNRERCERGLKKLEWSEPLAAEARHHSRRMAIMWFFSHTDPERGALRQRLKEDGIRWRRIGENIYQEKGYKDPAREAVEAWLNSPPHRETMLDPIFTRTGVGVAVRADGMVIVTADFIHP